jgi:hypothetical protein
MAVLVNASELCQDARYLFRCVEIGIRKKTVIAYLDLTRYYLI